MTTWNRKDKVHFGPIFLLGLFCFFLILGGPVPAFSQKAKPASTPAGPDPWPKSADVNGTQFTIYQPQLDTWDGYRFEAHAAVSVLPPGYYRADFRGDQRDCLHPGGPPRKDGTVCRSEGRKTDVSFRPLYRDPVPAGFPEPAGQPRLQDPPRSAGDGPGHRKGGKAGPDGPGTKRSAAVRVFHRRPRSWWPSTVNRSGVRWKIPGLTRVLNTRALLLKDPAGPIYLHLFDGFLGASSLSGPWTVSKSSRPMSGRRQDPRPDQGGGPDGGAAGRKDREEAFPRYRRPPDHHGHPAHRVDRDRGPAGLGPDPTTNLLYLKNTTANVFKNLNDQQTYVLVTGRWFRAPDFTGPWQYVAGNGPAGGFCQHTG